MCASKPQEKWKVNVSDQLRGGLGLTGMNGITEGCVIESPEGTYAKHRMSGSPLEIFI